MQTKSEMINRIAELAKENTELKAENERLKEELATYGATGVCEVCSDKASKLADKYLGCLQEIRDIAERTDSQHPASVCNMVSVIRRITNEVIGAE